MSRTAHCQTCKRTMAITSFGRCFSCGNEIASRQALPGFCPKCNGPLGRQESSLGGLIQSTLVAALHGPRCPKCGPIPLSELSSEGRRTFVLGSVALAAVGLVTVVIFALIVVHVFMRRPH
jgi:uncharacterized membrane protein